MRKYEKPFLKRINLKGNISSLNDWLTNEGSTYQDAGITTYIIKS